MELTGTVIAILPEVTGQGKNGSWRKQEFILEIPSQYPKKVCISLWGDKIDQSDLRFNETLTASIEVESREHNSRWYTEVKAWKISKGASSTAATTNSDITPPVSNFDDSDEDSLPF